MHPDPETMASLQAQTYADPADAPRPAPRRRTTVRRLMGYVAASALAVAFLPPSLATAVILGVGISLFAPVASGWTRFELGAAAGWLAGVVVAVSGVMTLLDELGFLFLGMLLGLAWLIRIPFQIWRDRSVRGLATLLVVPAAVGLGVLAVSQTDLVFAARLATSEAALIASAGEVAEGESASYRPKPRWIGLVAVEGIERRDGIVLWQLGTPFLDDIGLAYIPDGRLPSTSSPKWPDYDFQHLRGPWWRYTHVF